MFVGRDDEDGRRAGRLAVAVGIRRLGGFLHGGMTSWWQERRPVDADRAGRARGAARAARDDREVQLLDVRERSEWEAGHIPGSHFVPWHDIDALPDGLDPARPIAVICALRSAGGDGREPRAPRGRPRGAPCRRRRRSRLSQADGQRRMTPCPGASVAPPNAGAVVSSSSASAGSACTRRGSAAKLTAATSARRRARAARRARRAPASRGAGRRSAAPASARAGPRAAGRASASSRRRGLASRRSGAPRRRRPAATARRC